MKLEHLLFLAILISLPLATQAAPKKFSPQMGKVMQANEKKAVIKVAEDPPDPMTATTTETTDPNEGFIEPSTTSENRAPSSETSEDSQESSNESPSSDAVGIEGNSGSAETDEAEQEDD